MSIHQPRYSIFKQCDTLTLLSLGNVVYHGSAQSALGYFEMIGKVIKLQHNVCMHSFIFLLSGLLHFSGIRLTLTFL